MEKLLSIIVPSYNMEKYLPKCLSSVCDAGEKKIGVGAEKKIGVGAEKKIGVENRCTAEFFDSGRAASMRPPRGDESGALIERALPKSNIHSSTLDFDLSLLDIIVVNDGSKDRTSEIAHDFERRYPGVVRVIDKPNGNYGSCINAALPVAAGRFVKILDADDTFEPEGFSAYLHALAEMPENVDAVLNDFIQVDETGAVRNKTAYPLPSGRDIALGDLVKNQCEVAMHGIAHRTALLREIGYTQLEGISYTDTEWFYLPVAHAKAVRYVPQTVYRYLVGRAGQTMESATWIKNVWMMDKIFSRMMGQYEQTEDSHSREYLAYQLTRMFRLVIGLHASGTLDESLRDYLLKMRSLSARYVFLPKALYGDFLFARMPVRFHYLVFILKHPAWVNRVMRFVNWYNKRRSQVRIGLK